MRAVAATAESADRRRCRRATPTSAVHAERRGFCRHELRGQRGVAGDKKGRSEVVGGGVGSRALKTLSRPSPDPALPPSSTRRPERTPPIGPLRRSVTIPSHFFRDIPATPMPFFHTLICVPRNLSAHSCGRPLGRSSPVVLPDLVSNVNTPGAGGLREQCSA